MLHTSPAVSLFVILAVLFAAQQALAADPKNKIVVSEHGDEGPADRYATPYTPIVYGHRTAAPLPGLARAYELHDWDGDGRMDVLALLRRGGGLVVHRNVGEPGEPRFTEPRRSQRVMDASRVGSGFEWYAAADLSGDGTVEIVCEIDLPDDRGEALAMFINDGSAAEPDWRRVIVRDASGEPFDCDGYFALGDVTADGRADLIITSFDESDATDIPKRGRRRLMRFPPPDKAQTKRDFRVDLTGAHKKHLKYRCLEPTIGL